MGSVENMSVIDGRSQVMIRHNQPEVYQSWSSLDYTLGGIGKDLLRVFNWLDVRHTIERIDPKLYPAALNYERICKCNSDFFLCSCGS